MKTRIIEGTFQNGIPYLKMGSAEKIAIMFLGGPGNTLPKGLAAFGFAAAMKKFMANFTIFLVCRKSNLTEGYSTSRMADDYADLISNEFGGHVDLIIGFSYGGLIAQHFCAKYHLYATTVVIGGSAHKISPKAIEIDYNYAKLLLEKKDRRAMAIRSEAVFQKGVGRVLFYIFLWIFGKIFLGKVSDTQRKDTMIEAEAELKHDSTAALDNIKIPVLIVCGQNDFAFDVADVQEMASKIKTSKLLIYECGHSSVIFYKTFYDDVMNFHENTAPGSI
ncbi:MAG TPA: alpha/beta hydrolase [Bacillota bacterium]|nr:alpha/beta hydrolase [Bacillota bacterium]